MQRTFVMSIALCAMLLVGIFTTNGLMVALALPFVLALGVAILYATEELNVSAERQLSTDKLRAGNTLDIILTVTNHGDAIAELTITDLIPRGLTVVKGATSLLTELKKGEKVTLSYTLSGPRGEYTFPKLNITATDRLGLFWRYRQIDVEGTIDSLMVLSTPKVGHINIRPRQTRSFAGYIPARVAGSGLDFFGVREYRPGDSLRHINWRANARHQNTLFTNEFEQERVADVGLILDARSRCVVRAGNSGLFEHLIAATDSFADSFLGSGNRVSLLIYGNYLDWTLPGYGKVQRQRVQQALSRAVIGNSMIFEKLTHLPTTLFPVGSQIILFSTLLSDDVDNITRMRARGYSVLVISPDPIAFEANLLPDSDERALGRRIAQIERELLMRKLRQSGIHVVEWNVEQPLKELVEAKLQRNVRVAQGAFF